MPEQTQPQPAWKRERLAPIQGPRLPQSPPVWKPGHSRTWAKPRGPWQKRTCASGALRRVIDAARNAGFAVVITASIALTATPAHAQADEPDMCNMNSGPENVSLGALLYVREVMDDAIIKYKEYKSDPKKLGALQQIEVNNDYLCDLPRDKQATLLWMTDNVLIWILDILQS